LKKPAPSNISKLTGIVVGYLAGDALTSLHASPFYWVYVSLVGGVLAGGALVVLVLPQFRQGFRHRLGQLGVWLTSLIMGGILPLLKMAVYSFDFYVWWIFLPIYGVVLYGCLLIQEWFVMPRTP